MSGIIYGLYEQIINEIIMENLKNTALYTCLGLADCQKSLRFCPDQHCLEDEGGLAGVCDAKDGEGLIK